MTLSVGGYTAIVKTMTNLAGTPAPGDQLFLSNT